MKISEPIDQIYLMKTRLLVRLNENEYTKEFLSNLEEFGKENDKLGSDSLLKQIQAIKQNKNMPDISETELIDKILHSFNSKETDGLIDSIKFCFQLRTKDVKYNLKLHLLLTNYKYKIP